MTEVADAYDDNGEEYNTQNEAQNHSLPILFVSVVIVHVTVIVFVVFVGAVERLSAAILVSVVSRDRCFLKES